MKTSRYVLALTIVAGAACARPAPEASTAPMPAASSPAPAPTPEPAALISPAAPSFECTLLLGIGVTSEWFTPEFEKAAGDGKWEAIFRKHTFVQHWADPAHEAWSEPVVSPCSAHPEAPERVLFVAANWDLKSAAEWIEPLEKVVATIKGRYPSLKQIELMTIVRPPGNVSCGNAKSAVAPFIDDAIAQVSARSPELVRAAPKFEAASCEAFTKGGPHLTPEGGAGMGKIIAQHYSR